MINSFRLEVDVVESNSDLSAAQNPTNSSCVISDGIDIFSKTFKSACMWSKEDLSSCHIVMSTLFFEHS